MFEERRGSCAPARTCGRKSLRERNEVPLVVLPTNVALYSIRIALKTRNPLSRSCRCDPGHYCPLGTSNADQYPCLAGTYTDATNLTSAIQCRSATKIGSGSSCIGPVTPFTPSFYLKCMLRSACLSASPPSDMEISRNSPAEARRAAQHATFYPVSRFISCNHSDCPERKACLSGSTSDSWSPCGTGHYCPQKTPSMTSYPCPAGSYTDRTDLADASECYPCPLGEWCGAGADAPDGPCEAGYYCPLSTAAATDNPCPAGTYSDSTSLYMESQCEDCPPG